MSDLDPRALARRVKESDSLLEGLHSGKARSVLWRSGLTVHEELLPSNATYAGTNIEEIRYGFSDSPFGVCRIELGPQGILGLDFLNSPEDMDPAAAQSRMGRRWPGTVCLQDQGLAETSAGDIFSRNSRTSISLHLRGSSFQLKIWRSLLTIPESFLLTYARLAALSGCPGAFRAAGSALASNPIGYLIPCHRVLRADGHMGGYKWGLERKRAMIAYEARLRDSGFRAAEDF